MILWSSSSRFLRSSEQFGCYFTSFPSSHLVTHCSIQSWAAHTWKHPGLRPYSAGLGSEKDTPSRRWVCQSKSGDHMLMSQICLHPNCLLLFPEPPRLLPPLENSPLTRPHILLFRVHSLLVNTLKPSLRGADPLLLPKNSLLPYHTKRRRSGVRKVSLSLSPCAPRCFLVPLLRGMIIRHHRLPLFL